LEKPMERQREDEILRLRRRLWLARGRKSRMAGIALLTLSAAFLILAYISRYLVFEAISILTLLTGTIFIFTDLESYVKARVASEAIVSSLIPLNQLLDRLKAGGGAIYVPNPKKEGSVKVLMPRGRECPPTHNLSVNGGGGFPPTDVNGIPVSSTGSGLLQLYRREFGSFRNVTLPYLAEWLPRILVEDLKIAEGVEIVQDGAEVHVRLISPAFRQVCQQRERIENVCKLVGCPISSSIAEALAETTGRLVQYVGCKYDPIRWEVNVLYRLGPVVEA